MGAYLIGLWGLPDALVETIAYHHRPVQSTNKKFGPLAALYLADALEHKRHSTPGQFDPDGLDTDYLAQVGLAGLAADPTGVLGETNEADA